MIKIHYARDMQRAVQGELNWFSSSYQKPSNIQMYPCDSSIKAFQELLYAHPFDTILPLYSMTPDEMARVCISRWISSDQLMWMSKILNSSQMETFCCLINAVIDIGRLVSRKLQSHKPKRLVFFVNVAVQTGKLVLATGDQRGIHWTLCQVDAESKTVAYADTLGWQIPDGLLEKVNQFTRAIYKEDTSQYEIRICHDPLFTENGLHSCGNSCSKNYPVQTCSSVCGVISMVMAAVATHKSDLFKEMTSRTTPRRVDKSNCLQNPTGYSNYLRRVVAAWIADNKITLEYVLPQASDKQFSDVKPPEPNIKEMIPPVLCDLNGSSPFDPNVQQKESSLSSQKSLSSPDPNSSIKDPSPFVPNAKKQEQSPSSLPSSASSNVKSPTLSATKKPSKGSVELKCPHCSAPPFARPFTFKRHLERKHKDKCTDADISSTGACICDHCQCRFWRIKDLRKHLTDQHGVIFNYESLSFENKPDFEAWKATVEELECCSLVKMTGAKMTDKHGEVQYYNCNRCGTYRPSEKGIRLSKSQGSSKINMNCTAGLKVCTTADGKINVNACHTHHGHRVELQHTWLSKQRRQEIACKLRQGVPSDKILDDIRQSKPDNLYRHHIIEKKDINNIQMAYGLKDVRRHENDQRSVLAWIEEWKSSPETNPILFHKMQGDKVEDMPFQEEDFMIIVQSPFQKTMLQKLGIKGVCIDSTHGTTGYDFSLTTLMVIDEFGSGIPVAWCLSNHEDTTFMTVFFNKIKDSCGVIEAKWFMSDMANQFYNAWVGVMGHRPQKLVCIWHVDKAWRESIRERIKDTMPDINEVCEEGDVQNRLTGPDVYKMLRTVLEETNQTVFSNLLDKMLKILQEHQNTKEFYNYFVSEWVPRDHEWAFCYRLQLGITTNMHVEAFNRTFKVNYLKGKFNQRVDTCLLNLVKFSRDNIYERTVKLTKGKLTSKVKNIQHRHMTAVRLLKVHKSENVQSIEEGEFNVASEDGNGRTRCCIRILYALSSAVLNVLQAAH